MVKFDTAEYGKYTILHFELEGPINPEILKDICPPKVNSTKGLIISGRGPIWLYCYLVHYYHFTVFIATFDPRLGGAVIVESHIPEFKPGNVIML
ncbi:CRISPR-associated ring nuclease Crn3/Csx3 [Thermosediminibacter oceani]|uniref:CRISPR-associated protein, Csx3 family n=1 Tax=Thermosediminibacter oceani (strain ATCC BAA-1034 / DSM 16646 / JW/IW-1228P) TaxID=555079 RepID=D9S1M9_THEOJ|nr:CRISPR-associated ring nuclease Crn3/Csx3 [Thermosediminibacter oceani]ADL07306.1 CRISPR-associated protein, Csx3 family [Thermosediminibacter oceani DSM 16646]